MTGVVVVLVCGLVVLSALGWVLPARRPAGRVASGVLLAGLATLGLLGLLHGEVTGPDGVLAAALLVDLFVVAVAGGGPLTATVLSLVDRGLVGTAEGAHAEEVLRGGAWIGVFERAAVFATLAAGWPEGLAVVLALKGLGRYSELRADAAAPSGGQGAETRVATGGVAERFLVGSFASMLWAVGCAGVLLGLT
ncbi:MAG: hypothetical protein ACLGH4_03215 [Actinomycetes bacterium]